MRTFVTYQNPWCVKHAEDILFQKFDRCLSISMFGWYCLHHRDTYSTASKMYSCDNEDVMDLRNQFPNSQRPPPLKFYAMAFHVFWRCYLFSNNDHISMHTHGSP